MTNFQTIHFIGIKGVGMAALAILAQELGSTVTGSDEANTFVTDEELQKAQIPVFEFDVSNLKTKPDLVVVSAAYDKNNIEVKEAHRQHLEIISYSEALAHFSKSSKVIAVGGIHGKTTTTAMVSFILSRANLDPSYLIGASIVASLGGSAHHGQGEYFVLEADEYKKSQDDPTPKFLDLSPAIEVITSIELDHPDMFATEEEVFKAFYDFACLLPRNGFIVLCADYAKARKLANTIADRVFETYGFLPEAKWQVVDLVENEEKTSFNIRHDEKVFGPFSLKMPGKGNVLNAAAAAVLALKLGISETLIKKSLAEFSGIKRRFEIIRKFDEVVLMDDYAHHPRAISLTLEAIKKKNPKAKIWCIFQPHTYSRTRGLLREFAQAFGLADKVIITDIYASAREQDQTITGQELALEVRKNQHNVKFIDDWEKIIEEINDNIKKPAVIVTMGAGDIYKLQDRIYEVLKNG